jgi:hypothetical protein
VWDEEGAAGGRGKDVETYYLKCLYRTSKIRWKHVVKGIV